jgi:hypothetical protein
MIYRRLSYFKHEVEKEKGRKIFLLDSSFLKLGPVQTGRPPPGKGGGGESESLRVFNPRQESGNGTRELRTGPDLCLNMGPESEAGSRSPSDRVAVHRDLLSGILGGIQRVSALCFW